MQLHDGRDRIQFIDIARFLSMVLVFYGHFIERIMYLSNPTAAAQYKFIYSFHMVLFFVIAGYVAKDSDLSFRFGKFLKHRLSSRLLPFFFFTVLFMMAAAIFPGDFFQLKLPSVAGYIDGLISTVFGIPMFCVPSWFILIIFSVEFIHYAFLRFMGSDAKIVFGIVAFYLIGYVLNWKFDIVNPIKGRVVGWNYLFIHESIIMYSFYLLGVFMRRKDFLLEKISPSKIFPAAGAMFFIVLFTYRLNSGLFSFPPLDAVVILFSSHGHFIWFPVTAIAGSLMILLIARGIPVRKTITWMGRNTLILMCLNGIFYHYINPPAAKWFVSNLPGTPTTTLLIGCAMTVASLIFCIPLIYFFNQWVPQLVGKPKVKGPLIKNLI